MAGIYQINQQTGSVILPTPGNTFIGTSNNSELYTVDSSGNVTIYGTGGGSTIDTGSFATTGSNIFVGNQTITGSITMHGTGFGSPILDFENDGPSSPLSRITGQSYGMGSLGGLNFSYYDGSLLKEGFRLRDGKLGIGTINPSAALTVSGSISSSNTIYSNNGIEITGSINSISQTPSGSQGIVQINDGDLLSIFPAFSGSGIITSGSFMGIRYTDPNNISFNAGVSNIGNNIKSTGFAISSGSNFTLTGGLVLPGGEIQSQMLFSPDFMAGDESYEFTVGKDISGENRLSISKEVPSSGGRIQLRASNLTEGFVIKNSFSDVSSSLFKIEDSGSISLFDARNNGVVLPIVSQSLDYVDDAAAGTAGVPLGGVYRSGSILKIRIS
jgi:hypothetical protein